MVREAAIVIRAWQIDATPSFGDEWDTTSSANVPQEDSSATTASGVGLNMAESAPSSSRPNAAELDTRHGKDLPSRSGSLGGHLEITVPRSNEADRSSRSR